MIAGFDWWLLLVGIVGGAGLAWLVIADFSRHDEEMAADERSMEVHWIAEALAATGRTIDDRTIEEVLGLHRAYLSAPAPGFDPAETEPATSGRRDATAVEGDGTERQPPVGDVDEPSAAHGRREPLG